MTQKSHFLAPEAFQFLLLLYAFRDAFSWLGINGFKTQREGELLLSSLDKADGANQKSRAQKLCH